MYRNTCMPWIEDTTACASCGVDTESNDMLCDDCDAYQNEEDEMEEAAEKADHEEANKDPMGWDRYDELVASAIRNS